MKRSILSGLMLVAALLALESTVVFAQKPVAVEPKVENGIAWFDAREWPVENKCWTDVERYFARLPKRAEALVTKDVWTLSQHSAGEVVRFRTNANVIKLRYKLWAGLSMPHMPATGVSGFDLYAFDKERGAWRWAACTKPTSVEAEVDWIAGLDGETRDYMAYLPLYNGVESMVVGVPEGAEFVPLAPREEKPIVYYGTSVAQGGCVTHPGVAYTAILNRRLDVPVVNLGFSGSAKMEPEMADLLAEVDAEIYVLDTPANMDAQLIDERAVPFVKRLREKRPDVPILMVEDHFYTDSWIIPARMERNVSNHVAFKKAFDALKPNDPNLYYLSADNLIGDELDSDAAMDGAHLSDLGMYRQAEALEAVLRPILELRRAARATGE